MVQRHIMVVEDDSSLRGVVRDILELNGYRTYPAANGQQALTVLEWLRADLIISDIMMPVMDGYNFYRQVRSRPEWLHIPFIFLTAKGSRMDVLTGKQLGVDDYLVKPFDSNELLVTVSSKLAIAKRWNQVRQREIVAIKRNIINILNHEFRTPLTYISAYTQLLVDGDGQLGEEDFREFCRGILIGSQRLRTLVDDFLLLVQLETGEARFSYENRRTTIYDLPALLQKVIRHFRGRARKKELSIELRWTNNLRPVVADVEYLSDAVGRLIDNAIKFSAPGAEPIVVSVSMAGNVLQVAVSDRGVGVPPEQVEGLFQVLHQVNREEMEQQGSGSGLAISKALIALHGGDIHIESQAGKGSTFTILLPTRKRGL